MSCLVVFIAANIIESPQKEYFQEILKAPKKTLLTKRQNFWYSISHKLFINTDFLSSQRALPQVGGAGEKECHEDQDQEEDLSSFTFPRIRAGTVDRVSWKIILF